MHLEKSKGHLVETISDEVFRVLLVPDLADSGQGASIHVFEKDYDHFLKVVECEASDDLITVEEGDQTGLVDDALDIFL